MPSLPDHATLWAEARAALDGNRELLATVAAATLLLPQLILGRWGGTLSPQALADGDGVLFLLMLAALVGQTLAQLFSSLVLLSPGAPTGGALLARAAGLLPAGLVASLCQSLCLVPSVILLLAPSQAMKVVGLLLLAPGLYLLVRLCLAVPALAAGAGGPVAALRDSFERTSGQVAGLVGRLAPVLLGFLLLLMVLSVLVAILLAGSPPDDWGARRWLGLFVTTAAGAGMTILLALMLAVLWRALAGDAAAR